MRNGGAYRTVVERTVARDYAFRTTRVADTLDHWLIRVDELSAAGMTVCNVIAEP